MASALRLMNHQPGSAGPASRAAPVTTLGGAYA